MVRSTLVKALDGLLREKGRLATKTQALAKAERTVVEHLSRALSGIGYRVVPSTGDGVPLKKHGRTARKRLRCPECDRRFSHPLPMARHLVGDTRTEEDLQKTENDQEVGGTTRDRRRSTGFRR